jgi:hypothetical protein
MTDPTAVVEPPTIAVAAPVELAGQCVAAHIVVCGICLRRVPIYHPRGIKLTKEWAERQVRAHGWVRRVKPGWVCPNCKGAK